MSMKYIELEERVEQLEQRVERLIAISEKQMVIANALIEAVEKIQTGGTWTMSGN